MTYDTRPFIDPVERAPGYHEVRCRVTWTPREGDPVAITGEYLDGDGVGGMITLGCGIDGAATDLGVESLVLPCGDDYLMRLCELVDRQLEREPHARLVCPEGTLDIAVLRWG